MKGFSVASLRTIFSTVALSCICISWPMCAMNSQEALRRKAGEHEQFLSKHPYIPRLSHSFSAALPQQKVLAGIMIAAFLSSACVPVLATQPYNEQQAVQELNGKKQRFLVMQRRWSEGLAIIMKDRQEKERRKGTVAVYSNSAEQCFPARSTTQGNPR